MSHANAIFLFHRGKKKRKEKKRKTIKQTNHSHNRSIPIHVDNRFNAAQNNKIKGQGEAQRKNTSTGIKAQPQNLIENMNQLRLHQPDPAVSSGSHLDKESVASYSSHTTHLAGRQLGQTRCSHITHWGWLLKSLGPSLHLQQ